jgi:hypothetical protein
LDEIRRLKRLGAYTSRQAAQKIAALQATERLGLRSGTKSLHRAKTITKYLRLGRGATMFTGIGTVMNVGLEDYNVDYTFHD